MRETNEMTPCFIRTYPTSDDCLEDADLSTRAAIALVKHQRGSWQEIRVRVRKGVVTLLGQVPSDHDRQLIIEVTQHIAGVLRVHDELVVAQELVGDVRSTHDFVPASTCDRCTKCRSAADVNPFANRPVLSA